MSTIITNFLNYIWQPNPPTEKIIETNSDPMFYSSITILIPPPNNNNSTTTNTPTTNTINNGELSPSQNELP